MELKRLTLLIADISGYTQFVRDNPTELAAAENVVTELMEALVAATSSELILNKFEGDALLMYADIGDAEKAGCQRTFLAAQAMFPAFAEKCREIAARSSVRTNLSSRQILNLKLKIILHQAIVAVKRVAHLEELAGDAVILLHRLLKNNLEVKEYILLTEDFFRQVYDPSLNQAEVTDQECEGVGSVRAFVVKPRYRI